MHKHVVHDFSSYLSLATKKQHSFQPKKIEFHFSLWAWPKIMTQVWGFWPYIFHCRELRLRGAICLKISHLLQIYKSHTRYIYPTPDIIYPAPDIYTPLQIYIPHSRYNIPHSRYIYTPLYPTPSGAGIIYPDIYTPLQIYIPHSRYNISGAGYIYIWSGV